VQINRHINFLLTVAALAASAFAQKVPHFDAIENFRDIGGYKTADGHILRHNLIYRSGQLSDTTASDQKKLAPLGIRYEIDLRRASERAQKPSHWGPNPPKAIVAFKYPPAEDNSLSFIGEAGPKGPVVIANAADLGQIMRELAQGDYPALIHCSAGKDRAGMTVAVLMALLGVPRPDVFREYLRSNENLERRIARGRDLRKAANQPEPINPCQEPVPGCVKDSWLDASFQAIDLKYKSFDAYTRDGLKLTSADVDRLRAKLLQK
jgi:protein-tyrosine phosphatase